jgi:hypothetical protein
MSNVQVASLLCSYALSCRKMAFDSKTDSVGEFVVLPEQKNACEPEQQYAPNFQVMV